MKSKLSLSENKSNLKLHLNTSLFNGKESCELIVKSLNSIGFQKLPKIEVLPPIDIILLMEDSLFKKRTASYTEEYYPKYIEGDINSYLANKSMDLVIKMLIGKIRYINRIHTDIKALEHIKNEYKNISIVIGPSSGNSIVIRSTSLEKSDAYALNLTAVLGVRDTSKVNKRRSGGA